MSQPPRKGPGSEIGNDHELADYLIVKIRDEKYSPELRSVRPR